MEDILRPCCCYLSKLANVPLLPNERRKANIST